jgi:hypothetical protein
VDIGCGSRTLDHVRIAALASALGLVTACSPVAALPSLVVSKVNAEQALMRTTDDLSPGDIVHMWRYGCSISRPSRCDYSPVGDGIVTVVLLDSPNYAFVQFAPGNRVVPGDQASKDSPVFERFPDTPSE